MIEMLGVLAIVGVLSIGGIAGYSKAMMKWKINKTIEEYTTMVTGLMEYKDNIIKTDKSEGNIKLSSFIYQSKLVPESWKLVNNSQQLEDSFGNVLTPYIGASREAITIDYYPVSNQKGKSSDFAYQYCIALATQIAYPFFMQNGHNFGSGGIFISNEVMPNNGNYTVYSTSCSDNGKKVYCMSDMNLVDISKICKSCINRNYCNVGFSWN